MNFANANGFFMKEAEKTTLLCYNNNQKEGLLIVVENLEHIPNLNCSKSGAKMITFTKGRFEGRYGFLYGIN